MMNADIFVILDTVQFNPRHEENRTKLKSPKGWSWLTVPIKKESRSQLIRQTCINNEILWQRKALGTLQSLYGRADFYHQYTAEITAIIETPYQQLVQLDRRSWDPALRLLNIGCRFISASELPVTGQGSGYLLNICSYLEAKSYLSGAFGREYLDLKAFHSLGINTLFHEYDYPSYSQRFGDFVPFLSYLDMLFNVGLNRDEVLSGGRIVNS
jgi:hypothetical protein